MRNMTTHLVVLTATRNRPELLRRRWTRSVLGQRRKPDHVVVVDDSDSEHRTSVRAAVAEVSEAGLKTTYVQSSAGPGLAAAWNSGLRAATTLCDDPWIAGLDDDDWWMPNHLEQCARTAESTGADVLFARSTPVREGVEQPRLDSGEPTLRAFLRGNPGFQGSTMFFRLSAVARVDGFDESMPSTLDRDLAVRLFHTRARWAVSEEPTVRFDVSDERERMGNPRSRTKREGLIRFMEKHRHLMEARDREAFWHRANSLFGFHKPNRPQRAEDSR